MLAMTTLLPAATVSVPAAGERTLYLYYTHTGETARITFWRNGRFDRTGLAQLNHFLRDWRRDEATEMDPNLFNLVWEVYQEVGATQPIHVVSAYRAPETNEMLRSRSSAVAKNSRHIQGKAMDFFIPGVPLTTLRAAAMKLQIGGVGYYPSSGSPFVHLDTGSVRAWPRMTTAQLQELFPDGKTLHLPTNGVPLSDSGRQYAAAQWQRCHQVPCAGAITSSDTRVASTGGSSRRTLVDLFSGDPDDDETTAVASSGPIRRSVTSQPILVAPVPPLRPEPEIAVAELEAPVPPLKPGRILLATVAAPASAASSPAGDRLTVAALDEPAIPDTPARGLRTAIPVQGIDRDGVNAQVDTLFAAYAPVSGRSDSAQRALEMLIEERMAETEAANLDTERADMLHAAHVASASQSTSARRALDMLVDQRRTEQAIDDGALNVEAAPIVTASFHPDVGLASLARGLSGPAEQPMPAPVVLPPASAAFEFRNVELVAPDTEHVLQMFTDPAPISGGIYAVIYEPDGGELDPATEIGVSSGDIHFRVNGVDALARARFEPV